LATLVPQGLEPEAYYASYPRLIAPLIVDTGFSNFFSSILFIIPAFVFFANLTACTIKRFARELKKKGPKRFGPDILHFGLMALVIGGAWSYSAKQEGSVTLRPGESVNLPDGSVVILRDFRFERYDDGRPRDWVSVLDVVKDEKPIMEGFELRVNKPLRYAGLTLYQATYSQTRSLVLADAAGREFRMAQGEELSLEGLRFFFMAPEGTDPSGGAPGGQPTAARAVLRMADAEGERVVRAAPGEKLGDVTILGFREELATGIQAVRDPGYPLVFAAFVLIAVGTAITFIQKLKEAA
jgi:cytochrome c biogenesis protein